jgi:hypothetical protein
MDNSGIFFHKYGRVLLVTGQDHLYLKGNKIWDSTNLNVTNETVETRRRRLKGTETSGRKFAAKLFRKMRRKIDAQSPKERSLGKENVEMGERRRVNTAPNPDVSLANMLSSSSPATHHIENKTKLGLTFHPSKSPDPHSFFFPFPETSTTHSSSQAPRCLFLFDLKAGPWCGPEGCGTKGGPPHWVTSLDGRIFSENCEVSQPTSIVSFLIFLISCCIS